MSARVKKGLFFTIAASVLFGISPIITAWASESIGDAMSVVFWVHLVHWSANMLLCRIRKYKIRLSQVSRQAPPLMALGVIGIGCTSYLLTTSYSLIGTGISTMIHFAYPAVVAILAALLRQEPFSARKGTALIFSCVGICLLTELSLVNADPLRYIPAFLSAFTYALYLTANGSRRMNQLPGPVKCAVMSAGICIFFGLVLLLRGGISAPSDIKGWICVLLAGLQAAAGYNGLVYGIRQIGPSQAAFATLLEPCTSMVIDILVTGAGITLSKLAGCCSILIAVYLNSRNGKES